MLPNFLFFLRYGCGRGHYQTYYEAAKKINVGLCTDMIDRDPYPLIKLTSLGDYLQVPTQNTPET